MSRRLIVNADDFGRSPGINRGIAEAHQRGILTSTTLMTNLSDAADAAELARELPTLGIGLHLNFCYGPPLASGPSSLLNRFGLLDRNRMRLEAEATADDIAREARAQVERFRALLGRPPTHIDSHQHMHTLPTFAPIVDQLAQEIGVPLRSVTAADRERLTVSNPDHFVAAFYGDGQIHVAALMEMLDGVEPGVTELMCHPGYDDGALADSSYRSEREIELATLTDPRIRQRVADLDIELVTFAVLA